MRSHIHTALRISVALLLVARLAHAGSIQQKTIGRQAPNAGPAGLVVDARGRIHITWESVDARLHYTRIDGRTRTDEVVDAQAPCGAWSSIALDSAGHPRIAYHAERSGEFTLAYAAFDGTAWQLEDLGPGGFATAIAIDANDQPHVVHEVTDVSLAQHFEYVHHDDSGWHHEQPPNLFAQWSDGISLALDRDGHAHVAMDDPMNRQAIYATNSSGDWVTTVLGTQSLMGQSVLVGSLALDSVGRPHVALRTFNPSTIRYSHFDGSQWLSEDLFDPNGLPPGTKDGPQSVALALDAHDRPSILFMDQLVTTQNDFLGDLVAYTFRSGDRWLATRVTSKHGYGHWTRLAASPDGSTVALYGQRRRDDTENLREARISVPDLTPAWTSLAVTPRSQGSRIDGMLQVRNVGPAKSGSPPIVLYLSSDAAFDSGDTPIGFRRGIGSVQPGRSRSVRISLQVALPVTGMYLIAVVDPGGSLDDVEPANNAAAGLLGN